MNRDKIIQLAHSIADADNWLDNLCSQLVAELHTEGEDAVLDNPFYEMVFQDRQEAKLEHYQSDEASNQGITTEAPAEPVAEEPKPQPKKVKKSKKRGGKTSPKPVQIWKDGKLIQTCVSINAAERFLGMNDGTIRHYLNSGHTTKDGYFFDHPSQIDECLAEINAKNKEPYQFSHHV